jgi:hypothetical protein
VFIRDSLGNKCVPFPENCAPPFPEKEVRDGIPIQIAISPSDHNNGRPESAQQMSWTTTGMACPGIKNNKNKLKNNKNEN